jgi:GNAT superfamily N-acetyltransferase
MHIRNGDAPYKSSADAMSLWPETATAIGVRLDEADELHIAAPYGLADLYGIVLRRSPRFNNREYFLQRMRNKQWQRYWPKLQVIDHSRRLQAAMGSSIRRIQAHELEDLLHLYRDLHEHDEPLERGDRLQRQWSRMLANPGMEIWVVEVNGGLAASCTLVIVDNLTRGGRPYALIENVVTRADQRRRGYGHAVLRQAIESARMQGCYKVMLMTGSKREEVHQFYEGAGFVKDVKTGFIVKLD